VSKPSSKTGNFCPETPGLGARHFPSLAGFDAWLLMSAVQKAIRRGDADLAENAVSALWRLRGKSVWRRLVIIAFEDIGVASVDAMIATCADRLTAFTVAPGRTRGVDDEALLRGAARRLALVAKDRSADFLVSIAQTHPAFEAARGRIAGLSVARQLALVADPAAPIVERAIAAWFASGMNFGDERRVSEGDRSALFKTFRDLGVPRDLVSATREAAAYTGEPITLMVPLLWLAASASSSHSVSEQSTPPVRKVGDLPTYALDKHCWLGKAAIRRFARECRDVDEALVRYVPEFRALDAAYMAAFYADAAPVSLRFEWNGCRELERLGLEADMHKAGVPLAGIDPLLAAVRDNLDHLDAIRAELLQRKGGQQ
jgi:hypothetical protein